MKELYKVRDVRITADSRETIARAIVLAESEEDAIKKYTEVYAVRNTLVAEKCNTDVWLYQGSKKLSKKEA